jgi:hypothetical protein
VPAEMPRSQPDISILIAVAVDYLDTAIYPAVSGPERYRTRVAINILRIVQRELSLGRSLDLEEAAELHIFLGEDKAEEPLELLTRQIETGTRPLIDDALRALLRRNLERALRVNNPRWLLEDGG